MVRIISALILAVTAAWASAQEAVKLVDNPPDRHIVVPGDTLWGIAGKFLKDPWRWPDVWRLNRDDIKNPHRIYPGDIIVLDLSSGQPQLKIAKPIKLQPQVYSEDRNAIPTIPAHVIEPFLSQPLVVEPNALDTAPRIAASQQDRVFLGNGDVAYALGIPDAKVTKWQVYRPGKALTDPDTGEILGHEAFFLGAAHLVQPGEPAIIRLTKVKQEVGRGDRLVPATLPTIASYVPHKPDQAVTGRVISIYGGVNEAGKHSIITLNRGAKDGVETGHVLALFRTQVSIGYDEQGRREKVGLTLPEERYALAFVFRTFERVAYALVMETTSPVIVGDAAKNP